jgi:hypothetical protein
MFKYTIKGITLNEEEAKEVTREYLSFRNALYISEALEIDMELAQEISEYCGYGLCSNEDIEEAVYRYIYDVVGEYLKKHNLATAQEMDEWDYRDLLEEKTSQSVWKPETLCEELSVINKLRKGLLEF